MKNKHTEGEWKVRFMGNEDDGENDFFVEAPNLGKPYNRKILGDDYGDHNGYLRETRLADAKLIAAAPELLWAIEYYFNVLDEVRGENWDKNPDHVLQKMLSAFNKATS